MRQRYLMLALLGAALPYSQFVPWLMVNGLDVPAFFSQLFANRISAFFAVDVIIAAIALIGFILHDGRRRGVRALWLPVAATCLVGVSCGLPLFLYMREGQALPGGDDRLRR